MHLIVILLIIVGALTMLSGVITFMGSSRADRVKSFWYLLTTFFTVTWIAGIEQFSIASADQGGIVEFHAQWGLVSVVLADAVFLGYAIWNRPHGKAITLSAIVVALILSLVIFLNPHEFYSGITYSNTGNSIDFKIGPLCLAYMGYFFIIVPLTMWGFWRQHLQTRSERKQASNLIMLLSFGIGSGIVMLADFILPLTGNWEVLWLGPLAIAVVVLLIYYVTLRYRELNLSSGWLRLLSYVVVITSIAIVYIIIFSLIFAALFRGSTPSTEVIVLNFIMILIFIALTPAMDGLLKFIQPLISEQKPEEVNEKKKTQIAAKSETPKTESAKIKKETMGRKAKGSK